jgi:hypothetical protein
MRYKSTLDLVARLDNDQYTTDETVTIKVPVAIPYQINSEYERVDGEFEYQGQIYRLVKQKFDSDTLFVVCIKDQKSNHIEQALTDYVKTFTDNPPQGKNTSKTLLTFIKDFLPTSINVSTGSTGWNYDLHQKVYSDFIADRSLTVFTPPPQIYFF